MVQSQLSLCWVSFKIVFWLILTVSISYTLMALYAVLEYEHTLMFEIRGDYDESFYTLHEYKCRDNPVMGKYEVHCNFDVALSNRENRMSLVKGFVRSYPLFFISIGCRIDVPDSSCINTLLTLASYFVKNEHKILYGIILITTGVLLLYTFYHWFWRGLKSICLIRYQKKLERHYKLRHTILKEKEV